MYIKITVRNMIYITDLHYLAKQQTCIAFHISHTVHLHYVGVAKPSPDKLRNTLVHEMCHAATWIIDNDAESHGPTFKKWYGRRLVAAGCPSKHV
jgi:predicted SprT family Zn-dependent metalloprotease